MDMQQEWDKPVKEEAKKPLPEKDWKDTSNIKLKSLGSSNRVVNMAFVYLAIALLIILEAIGVGSFVYYGNSGYFKPVLIDNSSCIMPVIPACPACPALPSIPACPEPLVNISLVSPSNLNVNATTITVNQINYTVVINSTNST